MYQLTEFSSSIIVIGKCIILQNINCSSILVNIIGNCIILYRWKLHVILTGELCGFFRIAILIKSPIEVKLLKQRRFTEVLDFNVLKIWKISI